MGSTDGRHSAAASEALFQLEKQLSLSLSTKTFNISPATPSLK
jgi:hypothetical protein